MNSDYYIGQGDAPLVAETLKDASGLPVDIQGAALSMTMTPVKGGSNVALDLTTNPVTSLQNGDGSDGSRGKISRQFTSAETSTPIASPGDHLVRFTATKNGKQISYPNTGYLVFTISPTAAAQQGRYLGVEELKDTLNLQGLSYVDRDLGIVIEAASRGLEEAFNGGQAWTLRSDPEIRYYERADERTVTIDPAMKIDSVDLDYTLGDYLSRQWGYDEFAGGGGTYATNLPSSSYRLLPTYGGTVAGGGTGEPFTEIELVRGAIVRKLPSGIDAIRVTGQFGWETIPAGVKFAVSLTATRFLRRSREAPFGIVALGLEGAVARVREIVRDPDIILAMAGSSGRKSLIV